jgi:hypothetical protein
MPLCHLLAVGLGWLAAAGVALPASGADRNADFQKAKAPIVQKFRSRLTADRVTAVGQLADYPSAAAASLVVKLGLADPAAEVREASYRALRKLAGNEEIAATLAKDFQRETRSVPLNEQHLPLLAVLAGCESPAARKAIGEWLDARLGTPKADPHLIVDFIDGLVREGNDSSLAALAALRETRHFKENFGYRRTNVQALTAILRPRAIDDLIALLPKLEGETCKDAVRHLIQLSGQNYGRDPSGWARWWREHRATFVFPGGAGQGQPVVAQPMEARAQVSFYGLAIDARRVVFVLDISGSMHGAKLAAAKQEFSGVVAQLPDDAWFGVVVFSSQLATWQPRLVPATSINKHKACFFVNSLQARGDTATYDALEAALRMDAEAVYLVTDGLPTCGTIVPMPAIAAAVARWNRVLRVSLYTIGIQVQTAPEAQRFLRGLAERNWGEYRESPN